MSSITRSRIVRSLLVASALALASVCFRSPVAAQALPDGLSRPASCSAKPARSQKYTAGVTKGVQKADELFASSEIGKNPQKLRNKISRVLQRLHDHVLEAFRGEAKDTRLCRVQGVADGFIIHIVELLGQCILDGAQWGQFTASLYCELSIQLGGLGASDDVFQRTPVGLCGDLFETACDGVYSFVATEGKKTMTSDVKRFCTQRSLNIAPYAGCAPYTQGNFASIFANSMAEDCAYSGE
jgi:hypothetical protein